MNSLAFGILGGIGITVLIFLIGSRLWKFMDERSKQSVALEAQIKVLNERLLPLGEIAPDLKAMITDQKALISGLVNVAKDQVSAAIDLRDTVKIFHQSVFNTKHDNNDYQTIADEEADEEGEIQRLMQESHLSRKDATDAYRERKVFQRLGR